MSDIELNEFSDSTNFYIILIIFFLFYIYLKFVFIKIETKISWTEVQCNPAYMLFGSIIDSFFYSESNNSVVNFDKCVRKIAERQLYEEHEKNIKEKKKKVNDDLTKLKQDVSGQMDDVVISQTNLLNMIDDTNLNLEGIAEKQNEINKIIIDSSGNISNLANRIGGLSDKFKTTIQSFIDSDLV